MAVKKSGQRKRMLKRAPKSLQVGSQVNMQKKSLAGQMQLNHAVPGKIHLGTGHMHKKKKNDKGQNYK